MYNNILIVLSIVVIITVIYTWYKQYTAEDFSPGTLEQLYTKGPQDLYLTDDTNKYLTPLDMYLNDNFLWNIPTRFTRNYPFGYYPYDLMYPAERYARRYYGGWY